MLCPAKAIACLSLLLVRNGANPKPTTTGMHPTRFSSNHSRRFCPGLAAACGTHHHRPRANARALRNVDVNRSTPAPRHIPNHPLAQREAPTAVPKPSAAVARFRHSANSKVTEVDEAPGFISAFDLRMICHWINSCLHTRPDTDADLIFQPAETGDRTLDISPLVIYNTRLYNSYYVIIYSIRFRGG
jgi:hypothetical protein